MRNPLPEDNKKRDRQSGSVPARQETGAVHRLPAGGNPLTPYLLCQLYHGLNAKYYGPEITVDPELATEGRASPISTTLCL